jgi:hypothetical protein
VAISLELFTRLPFGVSDSEEPAHPFALLTYILKNLGVTTIHGLFTYLVLSGCSLIEVKWHKIGIFV